MQFQPRYIKLGNGEVTVINAKANVAFAEITGSGMESDLTLS